jgi:L-lactate dehydrogenase complex protein LldG
MTGSVIENVRRSLGRSDRTPPGPRPAVLEPRRPGDRESEVERFLEEVTQLSGVAEKLTPAAVEPALRSLVAEQTIRKAAVWPTPGLMRLGVAEILHSLGVELVPPDAGKHEMALCDLGVTEADFLLAETGTLVLCSSAAKPRAVSLLPRVHLAVVRPELLRPDLHQVLAEAKDSRYLVFITGPSRTSDIELTVTLGVHGPEKLYVWMMGE